MRISQYWVVLDKKISLKDKNTFKWSLPDLLEGYWSVLAWVMTVDSGKLDVTFRLNGNEVYKGHFGEGHRYMAMHEALAPGALVSSENVLSVQGKPDPSADDFDKAWALTISDIVVWYQASASSER